MEEKENMKKGAELQAFFKMNNEITKRKLELYDELLIKETANTNAKRNYLKIRLDEVGKLHEYVLKETERLKKELGI